MSQLAKKSNPSFPQHQSLVEKGETSAAGTEAIKQTSLAAVSLIYAQFYIILNRDLRCVYMRQFSMFDSNLPYADSDCD